MGMFDYIDFSVVCPKCEKEVTGFQSKDGHCEMETLSPLQVDNFYTSCDNCDTRLKFSRPPLKRPIQGCMDDFELIIFENFQ